MNKYKGRLKYKVDNIVDISTPIINRDIRKFAN